MELNKPPKMVDGHGKPVQTDALSATRILISLSAQFNIMGRWIASQFSDLEQYGGLDAASDCFAAADVLLDLVKQWQDKLDEMDVSMPPGIGWLARSEGRDD